MEALHIWAVSSCREAHPAGSEFSSLAAAAAAAVVGEAMVGTPMVGAATGVPAGVMATAWEEEDAEEANGGVLV